MLKSENLLYKKMNLEDVYQFRNWGKHSSPLLDDYNFDETTEEGIRDWFYWKTTMPLSEYYVIFKDNIAIGYISFKDINKIFKTATLGLVLDPNYVNMGFGTEILIYMLDYFFNIRKFKKIYLKVAQFNTRAISLYKKLGFEKISTSIQFYENGDFDINIAEYKEKKENFVIILGKTFFYVDKMNLNRNKFNGVVKCISNFKI